MLRGAKTFESLGTPLLFTFHLRSGLFVFAIDFDINCSKHIGNYFSYCGPKAEFQFSYIFICLLFYCHYIRIGILCTLNNLYFYASKAFI